MMARILKYIVLICAFILPLKGSAQINFVRNGSFEDTIQCPATLDQIKFANYWSGIDSNASIYDSVISLCIPDLIHTHASDPNVSGPLNYRFHRSPRTGNAMAQMIMYNNESDSTFSTYLRDYLQGRLTQTLVSGKQYCLTFYTTIEQASSFAINHIGMYIDDGTIDTVTKLNCGLVHSTYTPQVYDTTISNDTLHWTKIQGTFTATGTEKFITIGNFFDVHHTDTVQVHYPSIYGSAGFRIFSWYLIDDVSIIAMDAVADAGHDTTITLAATDSAWVGNHDGYVPCKWYNSSGVLIDSNIGGFKIKPTVTTSYVMELEVCGQRSVDTIKVTVVPVSVGSSPFPSLRGVTCHPNPASSEVTVEGAKGCEVLFYDVIGRRVLKSVCEEHRALIDVSGLANGIYLMQFTNPATGERTTQKLIKE